MSDKITSRHLERAAFVYIRQSTLHQVRNNLESGRLQYALQDRARELGFKEVVVIDEDLGVSGTGSQERLGFSRLLTAVCNGQAGAVFALEASRLARNNRDWHHLIDLCVFTETLVVDAEGIYDPRLPPMTGYWLGLKGTMSEFELGHPPPTCTGSIPAESAPGRSYEPGAHRVRPKRRHSASPK